MRKILSLLLAVLSLFLLIGCDKNKDVEIRNEEYICDSYQVSGERLIDSTPWLSERTNDKTKETIIESDGEKFVISYDIVEETEKINFNLKINGEKFLLFTDKELYSGEFAGSEADFSVFDTLWLFDLDETDSYKEILVRRFLGLEYHRALVYRLTKDGLVELEEIKFAEELVKVNDTWIVPNYLVEEYVGNGGYNVASGYYMYDEGNFKYVDKFLTGEEIVDEQGNFPDGFKNLEFEVPFSGIMLEYEGGEIKGKFNFISSQDFGEKRDFYESKFVIRLVEDIQVYENKSDDGFKVIPAGTIINDATFKRYQPG